MSATALAEVDRPVVTAGATLRLYVPGIEAVPPLGRTRCSFGGCPLRATRREWVGWDTIYLALVCDGHRLQDDREL